MSIYVVGLNRLFWRRLYALAEEPLLPLTPAPRQFTGGRHMTHRDDSLDWRRAHRCRRGRKSFPGAAGATYASSTTSTCTLREGEIVALLGRSGSGKSTLLRTIAGLIAPDQRHGALPRHTSSTAPTPGQRMVFQSFALMPWLTVQDNVELGLARPRRRPGATTATRPRRDRHDRPGRLRIRLPQRTFRRHAATRRLRPSAGPRARRCC